MGSVGVEEFLKGSFLHHCVFVSFGGREPEDLDFRTGWRFRFTPTVAGVPFRHQSGKTLTRFSGRGQVLALPGLVLDP